MIPYYLLLYMQSVLIQYCFMGGQVRATHSLSGGGAVSSGGAGRPTRGVQGPTSCSEPGILVRGSVTGQR